MYCLRKFHGLLICVVGIIIALHYCYRAYNITMSVDQVSLNVESVVTYKYDEDGVTPLIKAATAGDVSRVRELIAQGAPLDAQSVTRDMWSELPLRNTALMMAIFSANFDQNYDIAKMLIAAGANVRISNVNGVQAVHFTQQMVNLDKRAEIVGLLVLNGADINAQQNDGMTILHLAIFALDRQWIEDLHTKFGSLIRTDLKNKRGLTPLEFGLDMGTADPTYGFKTPRIIIGLDSTGAIDVLARDPVMGLTGFMLAALRRDIPFMRRMLARNVDVNARVPDALKNSVLHLLLLHQDSDMVKFLIEQARVNPNLANTRGDRPLHYVLKIDAIGKPDLSQYIVMRNETAGVLIAHGAEVNAQNNDGNTVLHLAVIQNAMELVQYLVERFGTLINLGVRNNQRQTAVDLARALNRREIGLLFDRLLQVQKIVPPLQGK